MADEVTITIIEQPVAVTIVANEGTESVITKAQIEAVLIGDITSHNHTTQVNAAIADAALSGDVTSHNHNTQVAAALATLGSIADYDIWVGTSAAYAALGAWDATTLYFTTD